MLLGWWKGETAVSMWVGWAFNGACRSAGEFKMALPFGIHPFIG